MTPEIIQVVQTVFRLNEHSLLETYRKLPKVCMSTYLLDKQNLRFE